MLKLLQFIATVAAAASAPTPPAAGTDSLKANITADFKIYFAGLNVDHRLINGSTNTTDLASIS